MAASVESLKDVVSWLVKGAKEAGKGVSKASQPEVRSPVAFGLVDWCLQASHLRYARLWGRCG